MPLFTAETARAAAIRSHAANSARFRPAIPPDPPAQPPQPAHDEYSAKVLARTRTQLDLVANSILHELTKSNPDSRRLRDLSDAQRHLAEQERILAGRPLPGSRRPKDHEPRAAQHGSWMVAEPMVAPASMPALPALPASSSMQPPAQPDALPGGVTP
jgi:hypothetical protein